MTGTALDDFLLRHTASPTIAVAPALLAARREARAAVEDLRTVPDDALPAEWQWRPTEGETELRYGFYRSYELLEAAEGEALRRIVASGTRAGPAVPPIAAATAARWDLHGLLTGIGDELLDRDPGGDEWTIRQTLAHVVHTQRAYGWFTAWWHSRRDAPADDFPPVVPDDVASELPEESEQAAGTMAEIQARLDDILDLSAERLGGLDEDGLRARARWSGYPVTIGFRLGRWASHMREHTVQVEKTLAMLGVEPTEVDRLVRLILAAYGRLESRAYLVDDGDSGIAAIVERAARDARSVAQAVTTAVAEPRTASSAST